MLLQARPPCVGDDDKLSDVLHRLDEPSLSKLIRDHEAGKLDQICKAQRDRLGVGRWRSLMGFTYWGTLLVLPSLTGRSKLNAARATCLALGYRPAEFRQGVANQSYIARPSSATLCASRQ